MTYILDGAMTGEAIEDKIRVAATSPDLLRRAQRHGAGILRRDSLPPVPGLLVGFHRLSGSPATLILGSIDTTLRDGENVDILLNFLRKLVPLES
jgi:proteasome assembly chaperone (PAC2) family protein